MATGFLKIFSSALNGEEIKQLLNIDELKVKGKNSCFYESGCSLLGDMADNRIKNHIKKYKNYLGKVLISLMQQLKV